MWRDARPRGGAEYQDSEPTTGELLLEAKLLIRGDEYLEARLFRRREQLPIWPRRPAEFVSGGHLMAGKFSAQGGWRSLIEEDPHDEAVAVKSRAS
jgi:hypothetical protein